MEWWQQNNKEAAEICQKLTSSLALSYLLYKPYLSRLLQPLKCAVFQLKKLRHREVSKLALCHPAGKE
jgi:hypothetical protein